MYVCAFVCSPICVCVWVWVCVCVSEGVWVCVREYVLKYARPCVNECVWVCAHSAFCFRLDMCISLQVRYKRGFEPYIVIPVDGAHSSVHFDESLLDRMGNKLAFVHEYAALRWGWNIYDNIILLLCIMSTLCYLFKYHYVAVIQYEYIMTLFFKF